MFKKIIFRSPILVSYLTFKYSNYQRSSGKNNITPRLLLKRLKNCPPYDSNLNNFCSYDNRLCRSPIILDNKLTD